MAEVKAPDAFTFVSAIPYGADTSATVSDSDGDGCARCDHAAIAGHIEQIHTGFDIDGNVGSDALTDGLLIIRYLFGFLGDTLINGAVDPGCTRCTAAEIEGYCAILVP